MNSGSLGNLWCFSAASSWGVVTTSGFLPDDETRGLLGVQLVIFPRVIPPLIEACVDLALCQALRRGLFFNWDYMGSECVWWIPRGGISRLPRCLSDTPNLVGVYLQSRKRPRGVCRYAGQLADYIIGGRSDAVVLNDGPTFALTTPQFSQPDTGDDAVV